MKQKLATLIALILITGSVFAMPMHTRKQIKLKVEKKIEHRSSVDCPLQASIANSILDIKFDCPIDSLTVSITNADTGEIIYHTINTYTDALTIDLSRNDSEAEYLLELFSSNQLVTGSFTLN